MFARLVVESLVNRWRRKLGAVAAVALGTGAATGLLALFLGVGDLLAAEMRRYGANILVDAPGGTFAEEDLRGVRNHFWKNNVLGFAPFLVVEADVNGRRATVAGTWVDREYETFGETSRAGLATVVSGWRLDGRWMRGADEAMVGAALARDLGVRPGDRVRLDGRELAVAAVFSSGGDEERQMLVDLAVAQAVAGKPGRVSRALVSALVTPEAELAKMLAKGDTISDVTRQLATDPSKVDPKIVEQFNCTPYPTTIAMHIRRKIPGVEARPIRQATETEGAVLGRVRGAFLVLAILAAGAGALGVLAAMTSAVIDRRREIGLLKALGATDGGVAALLLTEAAILGVVGGLLGFGIGFGAARAIGAAVFASPPPVPPALGLLALLVAVAVALVGTAWPLRAAVRLEPHRVLHEA